MNNQKLTTKKFIERSKKIHCNKYNYSKSVYVNNKIKLEIICPLHGSFFQTPSNHINYGCIKCGHEKSSNACRGDKETFIKKSIKKHGIKYDYSKVNYINSNKKVEIICSLHGSFFQLLAIPNHQNSNSACEPDDQ